MVLPFFRRSSPLPVVQKQAQVLHLPAGNSWYVIDNHGTMTITGTANVVNNGYFLL